MAYTSIIPVHRLDNSVDYVLDEKKASRSQNADSLQAAVDYALNKDKTEQDLFCSAIGWDTKQTVRIPASYTCFIAEIRRSMLEAESISFLKFSSSVLIDHENFKNDMDSASSIEHRIAAMKQVYEAGIRTVCFVSPVFPGITDFEAIFERVKDQCDLFWLENLNLRGGFKKTIMDYIAGKYPDLVPLYDEIYNKHNRSYFEALEVKAEEMAKKYDCVFADNEMPYGRVPQGHPVIVDYFYHEEIRGTENTGKRNR